MKGERRQRPLLFPTALDFPCRTLQWPYPSITVAVVFDLGFVLSLCNTYTYCLIPCCSVARFIPSYLHTLLNAELVLTLSLSLQDLTLFLT